MPEISALERLKQEDQKHKTILGYLVRSCLNETKQIKTPVIFLNICTRKGLGETYDNMLLLGDRNECALSTLQIIFNESALLFFLFGKTRDQIQGLTILNECPTTEPQPLHYF
jgi:hypothetical protein